MALLNAVQQYGFCIHLNGQQHFTAVLECFTLQQKADCFISKQHSTISHMERSFIPNENTRK